MAKIDDARAHLIAAEESSERLDWAGTIHEAQACVELSLKALLDMMGTGYKPVHDVGDKIPEAFERLKHLFNDSYEVPRLRRELAEAAVLLRLLTAIREPSQYGAEGLGVGVRDTFGPSFEGLARALIDLTRGTWHHINNLLLEINYRGWK